MKSYLIIRRNQPEHNATENRTALSQTQFPCFWLTWQSLCFLLRFYMGADLKVELAPLTCLCREGSYAGVGESGSINGEIGFSREEMRKFGAEIEWAAENWVIQHPSNTLIVVF
ncbi:hypothetical protein NPIL_386551 [Nephila pilipes]|uniref:Uncharacterized protein n=1 Tax=Nephila pilipes TaxID=299642 RepID=A0A8X6III0_NEPPI|nr:hypothetical protein NPIL_386551 [Nephila pilipes]